MPVAAAGRPGFLRIAGTDGVAGAEGPAYHGSFAAFDALDSTGLITPLITSINQPAQQIGERAVDILLEQIRLGRASGRQLVLEPSFVDGDSW